MNLTQTKIDPAYYPPCQKALLAAIEAQDVLTPYFRLLSGEPVFPKSLPLGEFCCEYALEPQMPVVNLFVRYPAIDVIFEISFDIGDLGRFSEKEIRPMLEWPCGPWFVYGKGVGVLQTHDWDADC